MRALRNGAELGNHANACSRIVSKSSSHSPALPYFPRNVGREIECPDVIDWSRALSPIDDHVMSICVVA